MPQQAFPNHSLEAAPVLAWPKKSPAEGPVSGNSPFTYEAQEGKVQFAPHRVVTNYADYRRIGASRGWLLGW